MRESFIAKRLWPDVINENGNRYIVDIKFQKQSIKPLKYIIKLSSSIVPNIVKDIVLLFPTHPDEEKRELLLKDYSTYEALGKEVNTRINNSLTSEKNVKMAFIYNNLIYRCNDVVGTFYFIIATRVNIETRANQQNTISENVPIIIEMTGDMTVRNIILLHDYIIDYGDKIVESIPRRCAHLIIPNDVVLFPCEIDTRKDVKHTITTLSQRQADDLTRNPVVRRFVEGLESEDMPFSSTSDEDSSVYLEDIQEDEMTELKLTAMTPRVHLDTDKERLLKVDEQLF